MQNHRASSWSSLLIVALSILCFCVANRLQAHSRHNDSVGAYWMFFAAVGVFVFAVVMAARHRYWLDRLAAAIAAAIALAILFLVILVI